MQQGLFQIALTLIILIVIAPGFGNYMARVYMGQKTILDPAIKPLEEIIYKASNIRYVDSMTGWQYARSLLYSNAAMGIFVFLIFMLQGVLPLNPTSLSTPTWDILRCTQLFHSSQIPTNSITPARQHSVIYPS